MSNDDDSGLRMPGGGGPPSPPPSDAFGFPTTNPTGTFGGPPSPKPNLYDMVGLRPAINPNPFKAADYRETFPGADGNEFNYTDNNAFSNTAPEPTAEDVFRRLDADGSGAVSRVELHYALTKLFDGQRDPADIERLLREADANGDGQIQLSEFVLVYQRELQRGIRTIG